MGKALSKNQDYTTLNRMRWAAWGVIDIETMERMQRRNYINHVREELKLHGCVLECGGSTTNPHYRIFKLQAGTTEPAKGKGLKPEWAEFSAGPVAFRSVCLGALCHLDTEFMLNEESRNAAVRQG